MSLLFYCKEMYRAHGYSFYNTDILFEDPKLAKQAICQVLNEVDEYNPILCDRHLDYILQEYVYITEIQKGLAGEHKSKIDLDEELSKYRAHYYWGDIASDDEIKVIYWKLEFQPFIEFTKKNNLKLMVDIFNFDFNKLYSQKGFNSFSIGKIIDIFKSWCNKHITLKNSIGNKEDAMTDEHHQELISEVLNEFFK